MEREYDCKLRISEFDFDKAELVASGKIHEGDVIGRFIYKPFEGDVSIIGVRGRFSVEKAALKSFIKRKSLAEVFPLVGEEFIDWIIKKERTKIHVMDGFLQAEVDIEPSDVLLQLSQVTSKEQAFVKDGKFMLVRPCEKFYKVMPEGQGAVLLATYSDVVKFLGEDSRKLFDMKAIERGKQRLFRQVKPYGLFEERDLGIGR